MSGKYSSVMMFACLVAIAMAAQWAEDGADLQFGSGSMVSPRGPASVLGKKEPLQAGDLTLRHTEKVHGPVEASIELLGDRPSQAGDVFILKGLFTSSEDIKDVDFKWALPEGVELINGETHGRIAALGPSSPAEVQLTLKTKTGEDHKISLMAGATNAGMRFAASVHYSTLLEPVIEASREELKASTKKSMSADSAAAKKLRVMH